MNKDIKDLDLTENVVNYILDVHNVRKLDWVAVSPLISKIILADKRFSKSKKIYKYNKAHCIGTLDNITVYIDTNSNEIIMGYHGKNKDIKDLDFTIEKTEVKAVSRKIKERVYSEPTEDKHFDKYYTHHEEEFEKFNRRGWKSINVLEFLNDKPWDDLALGYVHALRPRGIRVTKGMMTLDCILWRVTVHVNKENIIQSITQEVEVGLPETVQNGAAMTLALNYGIDSPQCQWYNDEEITGYVSTPEGYYKKTKDGLIKFPKSDVDAFDEAGDVIK